MRGGLDIPEYLWTCEANHFVRVDVSDVTERLDDCSYEDWDPETLNGLEALKEALNAFCEANKDVVSYTPNFKKAVLLGRAAIADSQSPIAKDAG